jgi:YVTN family beta-propeller protein
MRQTGLVALVLLAVAGAGCGGNSTSIGVSITPAATSEGAAISVIEGQTQTFSSSVTGGSTTTVYWQICLPVGITSPPTQPTVCTPIPGVTSSSNTTLTGYGTITQNGVYTAPQSIPQTNPFVVMASSTVGCPSGTCPTNSTAFSVAFVRIDSGIRVSVLPTSATIGTQESYAVTAAVSGTSNTGVTWSVNNLVGGDITTVGSIVPGGSMCNPPTGPNCATYTAPTVTVTATITATSAADSSQSGKTTISVSTAVDPKLSSTNPTSTEQGAAQQDVYVQGSGFFSTSTILASGTPLPTTWVSTSLIRGTIPSSVLAQAAPGVPIPINVERQNGDLSSTGPLPLAVNAVRPSIVASSPDSVPATTAGYGLNITGGFFAPTATSATFDGFPGTSTPTGTPVNLTFTSSRQLIANIPAGALAVPGLYPVVLQNPSVASGSSTSFTNIAVEPPASTFQSLAAGAPIAVGSTPSAIAIDQADGVAVVANTGGNSVSIINIASNTVTQTVAVGNQPTGVAVDDGLSSPIAVVVNSKDNTVSTIANLSTNAVVSAPFTLPSPPPPQPSQPSPAPYSIGINPATHRAIVTYASTNVAAILDLSTVSSKGAPTFVQLVGGSNTNYGTGSSPQVSIDPRLNWAVVTAGGSIGNVNFVDLGRNPIAGVDPGRAPSAFGILSLSATAASGVAGVGVNAETHDVLLTMPNEGNFTTFSLMDQTVSTIPFTNSMGGTIEQVGYYAAAVNALSNIGIAVNKSGNTTVANTAAILDLQNHIVLGQVPVGNSPVAVAVDPATNEALVVNQADNTVSPISLGVERSSASLGSSAAPQITLSTPEVTFTSSAPLALTVDGGGFASGAQVYLDGTPLQTLSASGGQIVATIPASMLASARRYAVFVANPAQSVISNIEDLTVIQPIPVGAQPFGVAIDQECNVAAVTNSGDDTVSIVALTTNSAPPAKLCPSSPAVGTVGAPTPVGTTPQGVAIAPLLELAVVANNGSDNASVVDLTQTNPSATIQLCGGSCTGLGGVTINQDIGIAYVTGAINSSISGTLGNVAQLALPTSAAVPSTPSGSTAGGNLSSFFLQPVAAAFDQYIDYLGVAIAGQGTSGQPSTAQVYNVPEAVTQTSSSIFALPTGIVFDPLNQVFVVADSLTNNVAFLDPTTAVASFAQVGMNPTALDYNYQTSTLVTANNQSHTMSIIEYLCPPTVGSNGANGPNCVPPEVRSILSVGGSPQFSISIDIQLNLAVLTDESNNRVLLIPLP